MNLNVEQLLLRIQSTDFFRHSGNDTELTDVLRVLTPKKAERSMQSRKWQNEKLEMRNLISEKILSAGEPGKIRDRTWNDFTATVRGWLEPIMETRVQPAAAAQGLSVDRLFLAHIQWDLMSALQEAEFAEFGTIGFYHVLWDWYEAGYLPCGYDGQLVTSTSTDMYQFSATTLLGHDGGRLLIF